MSETPAAYRPHVALSTSSLYPQGVPETFEAATRLGYDSVEVLVTHERMSQLTHQLLDSVQKYQIPISTIHAPTLLFTQQVKQEQAQLAGREHPAHPAAAAWPAAVTAPSEAPAEAASKAFAVIVETTASETSGPETPAPETTTAKAAGHGHLLHHPVADLAVARMSAEFETHVNS